MTDTVTNFLAKLIYDLNGLSQLNGKSVVNSQQIAGTIKQRQEPGLTDRLSSTKEGAEIQKNLEAAKAQQPTTEDPSAVDNMSSAVADKYLDEMLEKFLESLK